MVKFYRRSHRYAEVTGKKLRKRPLQIKRILRGDDETDLGEDFDPISNYIASEFHWMTDALTSIAQEEALREITGRYDISGRLKSEAMERNLVNLVGGQENRDLIDGLKAQRDRAKEEGGLDRDEMKAITDQLWDLDPDYPYDIEIARGFAELAKHYDQFGKDADEDVDWDFINWIAENAPNDDARMGAATVLKYVGERKEKRKELLGREYLEWQDLVPEDYDIWTPTPGLAFYPAFGIPAKIAEELEAGIYDKY